MSPKVSIAIPVRNGIRFLARGVDSILSQDFADLELVISDNASDDGTSELCQRYAEQDPRVRHHRHERDIGQVVNFNYVFGMARGEYFKWAGVDDWLAPQYVSRCVEVLEQHPDVVCVLSHEKHLDDDGNWFEFNYDSFHALSDRSVERFRQMLTVYQRDPTFNIDPIYSMMRRKTLEQTGLFRPAIFPHIVMGAQLGLVGRFHQISETLAFRRKKWLTNVPPGELLQRYFAGQLPPTDSKLAIERGMLRAMLDVIRTAPVSAVDKQLCRLCAAQYFTRQVGGEFLRRAPGYPRRLTQRVCKQLHARLWSASEEAPTQAT